MRMKTTIIAVAVMAIADCSGSSPPTPDSHARPSPAKAAPRVAARQPGQCDLSTLPASCDGQPAFGEYGHGCHAALASWLERRCDGGDARCCGFLGEAIQRGHLGVAPDPARAASLLGRACDSGAMRDVCARFGIALLHGDGVARDPAGARVAFQKGCDLGDGAACLQLVVPYRDGDDELGVQRDAARAVALARRACDLGSDLGCGEAGLLLLTGSGALRDPTQGVALLDRACFAGVARSCRNLAVALRDGMGVPADPVRAAQLFRRACEHGDTAACDAAPH